MKPGVDDFAARAKRMADVVLAHEDTSATRRAIVALLELSRSTHEEAAAERAVRTVLAEGAKRTVDGRPCILLPHLGVTMLDELRESMGLPRMPRPGVLPGTWKIDGIAIGDTVHLGLDADRDHARREGEEGIRQARCFVADLPSDETGSFPRVRFFDADRTRAGFHVLEVEEFRQAMERASHDPEPIGPRR